MLRRDLDFLNNTREHGCPWYEDTCAFAAENGHLDVLKYAREQGCPWDKWTCINAPSNGHLDVLKLFLPCSNYIESVI
jgi:hypothetical protein